jgi:hypothetical protein
MRAYTSMPTNEFVAQLRDTAIKANAPPAVIDAIDAIVEGPDEDEIEARIDKAVDDATDGVRENQYERCVVALNAGIITRKGKPLLGLTMEQVEELQGIMDKVKPV